jgi:hypothetical protein
LKYFGTLPVITLKMPKKSGHLGINSIKYYISQNSVYTYRMEKATRTKNRIMLPTFGAELFTYLKDVNDHESFTASMRLKDVLSERLKNEINSWFSVPAIPELDRTLLRKITNSLLSAGTIGEKRTKDALSEIRFERSNLNLEMNVAIATEKLREWSRDFRSAKGFLDHQYKCINSFLRIQKTTNDENVRNLLKMEIASQSDFIAWQKILEEYWNQKGIIKQNLRNSYENIFRLFMSSFDDQIQNGLYHKLLDQNWQKYIDSSVFEFSTNNDHQLVEEDSSKRMNPEESAFEIDLRIEGGEIFYHILCNRLNELQASELRFKIALAISRTELFKDLMFSVSIISSDIPVILIRVDAKSDEEELARMVMLLEEVIERSKLPN